MKRTSWNDFDSAGLLWFINSILHVFGYAIALTYDTKTGKVIEAYPARVKYRGFKESDNSAGYRRITKYMLNNIDNLTKDINNDDRD